MATVRVSAEVLTDIESTLEGAKAEPLARQAAVPGNCTLVVIFGPDGSIRSMNCGGRCGIWDRFLGRSCRKITPGSGDGVHVSCSCQGGWWDSIFASRSSWWRLMAAQRAARSSNG